MSEQATLLIELGCEELPARKLADQARGLFDGLARRFEEAGLDFERQNSRWLATPRRLAVLFAGMPGGQPDQVQERLGPAVEVAFDDDGNPTRAGEGFARSVGLSIDQVQRRETEQGTRLYARVEKPGARLETLLPDMLAATLGELAGARSMRWSETGERFLRPLRWLVALHGRSVLSVEAYGLTAGRTSAGHRIHAPGELDIESAEGYAAQLEQAFVLADPADRRQRIEAQVAALAEKAGLVAHADPELIDEVANLVEWPAGLLCDFDTGFLDVPAEALVSSMQQHQKFFPLHEPDGALSNRFVAVANLESTDPEAVRSGFERVIRPRLADAKFFWDQDRRQTLESRVPALDRVVFQERLGSLGDKTRRLERLVARLASSGGLASGAADSAARAARLCKCDLLTEMVGEFPDLQGTMGRHYARHEGEPEAVAAAIESHYRPRFAADDLPADEAGRLLALADRLDTLVGVFAAGKKPRGSKDPFALRRAALGVARILVESEFPREFQALIREDVAGVLEAETSGLDLSQETLVEVERFILDRLRAWSREQGIETNTFHAVSAGRMTSLADFMARARAVQAFAETGDGASLIAANKRISNILKKSDGDTFDSFDRDLMKENAETRLAEQISEVSRQLDPLRAAADYSALLQVLSSLRPAVDGFFDQVMVMDEDPRLRANRLALLSRLRGLVADVADLAQLGR